MSNNVIIRLGFDLPGLQKDISQAQKEMQGFGKKLQSIGTGLTIGVTAPLALFGKNALQAGANFEQAMNAVKAVTQTTGSAFTELEGQAKELGRTTQFSATEAAGAIEMLAKNGLTAADIAGGALSSSLSLAAATGTDLSTAANIATDVMSAFNVKAEDMAGVVDQITGVTLNSKFGIEDFSQALAQGGGVAASLGVDLEDFNSSIAAIAPLFKSGSDAGTSFKTFLLRLKPQTAAAQEAMKELGLSFFDANGNMDSMTEVSGKLANAFAGLNEEQKSTYATTIFGTDAMRTAFALANTGSKRFDDLAASIAGVSATEQAETRLKGFNGAVTRLSSAFESFQIAIANSGILDFATNLANIAADLIARLSALDPEIISIVTGLAALAATIGPLTLGLGGVLTLLPTLTAGFAALTGPIGLTVAALTAGVVAIITNWDSVVEYFTSGPGFEFWNVVKDTASRFVDVMSSILSGLYGEMVKIWNNISGVVTRIASLMVDQLQNNFSFVFDTIINLLYAFDAAFRGNWGDLFKALANITITFANYVTQILGGAIGGLIGVIAEGAKALGAEGLSGALLEAESFVQSLTDKLKISQFEFRKLADEAQKTGNKVTEAAAKSATAGSHGASAAAPTGATGSGSGQAVGRVVSTASTLQAPGIAGGKVELPGIDQTPKITSDMNNLGIALDAMATKSKDAFSVLGEQLTVMATEGSASLQDLAKAAINAARTIVKSAIAEGVSKLVAGTLAQNSFLGPAAIPIGAAAGAAASALFNSMIPELADGALVSGNSIVNVGEYSGARNNPEFIAPVSTAQDMIGEAVRREMKGGTRQAQNVTIQIKGTLTGNGRELKAVIDEQQDLFIQETGYNY